MVGFFCCFVAFLSCVFRRILWKFSKKLIKILFKVAKIYLFFISKIIITYIIFNCFSRIWTFKYLSFFQFQILLIKWLLIFRQKVNLGNIKIIKFKFYNLILNIWNNLKGFCVIVKFKKKLIFRTLCVFSYFNTQFLTFYI